MTISAIPGGVRLLLHVQPGAARTEFSGWHGDRLKLRIAGPPVDGRANAAMIAWLAERCGVARRQVRVIRGAHARDKTVEIDGADLASVREVFRT